MSVKIKWKGDSFLSRLYAKLPDALEESAQLIEDKVKAFTPVKTGALKESITHETFDDLTATVSSNKIYAYWVEMGTRKMMPRAYFRKGLLASIEGIKGIFKNLF